MKKVNILNEIGLQHIEAISHFRERNTEDGVMITVFYRNNLVEEFVKVFRLKEDSEKAQYHQVVQTLQCVVTASNSRSRRNLDPMERFSQSRLSNIREYLNQV